MTDETATTSPAPRAPWHLWVVGGVLTLWNAFGVFDFTATLVRFEPYLSNFPEEMLAYIYELPLWMWLVWAVGTIGGFVGVVLLLLRSKLAVPLLAASALAAIGSLTVSFLRPPPGQEPQILLPIVIIAIAVLLALYAFWMSRRGVLR